MKRHKFLQTSIATATILFSPFTIFAKPIKKFREEKGFKVDTGKDRINKSINLFDGDTFDCKIATKDTDGDMYVFESVRVKEGGPSHHYHFTQDEWWYVLEGEFIIKVGDNVYNAKAGDSVFGPRMVPHSFAKIGEGKARLLMIFQPAGMMEEFFNKRSASAGIKMTEAEQDAIREAHGFKRVGPPIKNLKF
jgi:mannose-6-phosphate isomerase-like protein (cupin superfamily)